MDAKFEQKLKSFLPYIIIIGVVYLLVPALLFVGSDFVSYLVLIGILPLTAGPCCAHYAVKKESDFWLCLVAPIFFIPAMFLYPIFRSGWLIALIYLVAYLLCGYLGMTIGDILSGRQHKQKKTRGEATKEAPASNKPARRAARDAEPSRRAAAKNAEPAPQTAPARPERVDVDSTDHFITEDPYEDNTLDASTTSDDIDAILKEIHQRRGD